MQAVTVIPERKDSVELTDMPEPAEADEPVPVETHAIGICGTDLEIIDGDYGSAPPGDERHPESLDWSPADSLIETNGLRI